MNKHELVLAIAEGIADRLIENNGEITNGDVIKLLFPQIESKTTNGLVKVYYLDSSNEADDITIFEDWWNAPYKAESEDK